MKMKKTANSRNELSAQKDGCFSLLRGNSYLIIIKRNAAVTSNDNITVLRCTTRCTILILRYNRMIVSIFNT